MKKILVVDDSALMRRVICDIINADSNFEAKDTCRDGLEAYERLKTTSYDGVVLDVNMPRMDGLQLLEKLQEERIRANVIMVSTLTTKDAEITMMALERGAIDFVTKPTNVIEAKGEAFGNQLLSVLSAVLKISPSARPTTTQRPAATRPNSVERTATQSQGTVKSSYSVMSTQKQKPANVTRLRATGKNKLVALACSTGGPKALQDVIPNLDANMDAPVVLVQHMPKGFTKSMADRLNEISKVHVKEAEDGEKLQKGWVYVAPGGKHIEVVKAPDGSHKIQFNDMPAIGGLKPCANIMYDSLSKTGYDEIVCVVLTGMGADGTNGILSLVQHKPIHVIAQNEETCVVYGMPKAIADSGVVDDVVPLKEVAKTIIKSVGVN
ncbi:MULTISPECIES: chemotaxis-specific protein-glutamate methyltransferase CheB [Agathobacter]|uniref:Protein-glutamate methylesterase/protein-glutamine glutaminase n=1 Tax=Agathobacter ruminis TaxID=1712665 RepID=A0A2G3E511_9FIRM|nr:MULTISPECIES: chemotaxis-specific protein-glutamate methyltransferase CheB [Agathobacter]MBQ1682251.1 chemotaxis-specific protein-glutamate methyltransferase CheB [Agathobacter sp.]MCR5676480.1 chemotaxis-specific protein-glutamate methyltransferase CheB [Agathobacter sp.]MDC7302621.1 chemotaxis-specific protein-glutamate methyltransferase CheB [Agathobacter ruminis]PHU38250.1 chemotaxis response regulator protein-glutamate methylesterase [Agathobacter ruminis]